MSRKTLQLNQRSEMSRSHDIVVKKGQVQPAMDQLSALLDEKSAELYLKKFRELMGAISKPLQTISFPESVLSQGEQVALKKYVATELAILDLQVRNLNLVYSLESASESNDSLNPYQNHDVTVSLVNVLPLLDQMRPAFHRLDFLVRLKEALELILTRLEKHRAIVREGKVRAEGFKEDLKSKERDLEEGRDGGDRTAFATLKNSIDNQKKKLQDTQKKIKSSQKLILKHQGRLEVVRSYFRQFLSEDPGTISSEISEHPDLLEIFNEIGLLAESGANQAELKTLFGESQRFSVTAYRPELERRAKRLAALRAIFRPRYVALFLLLSGTGVFYGLRDEIGKLIKRPDVLAREKIEALIKTDSPLSMRFDSGRSSVSIKESDSFKSALGDALDAKPEINFTIREWPRPIRVASGVTLEVPLSRFCKIQDAIGIEINLPGVPMLPYRYDSEDQVKRLKRDHCTTKLWSQPKLSTIPKPNNEVPKDLLSRLAARFPDVLNDEKKEELNQSAHLTAFTMNLIRLWPLNHQAYPDSAYSRYKWGDSEVDQWLKGQMKVSRPYLVKIELQDDLLEALEMVLGRRVGVSLESPEQAERSSSKISPVVFSADHFCEGGEPLQLHLATWSNSPDSAKHSTFPLSITFGDITTDAICSSKRSEVYAKGLDALIRTIVSQPHGVNPVSRELLLVNGKLLVLRNAYVDRTFTSDEKTEIVSAPSRAELKLRIQQFLEGRKNNPEAAQALKEIGTAIGF